MFGILIIELIKCRIFMMILLRVLLLFIKKKNINPLKLCLDHAFSNKKLDYIIYGVTSLSELKEIIHYKPKKFINKKLESKIKSLFKKNDIDPRNWK